MFRVTLSIDEHVGGYTYVEKRFELSLRTSRDLASLQQILIEAANYANEDVDGDEETSGFEVLDALARVSR